jgi:hypothetical protein
LLHLRTDSREGGGEVVEVFGECDARVADEEGDELHSSRYFLRDAIRGEYFSFSPSILMSQPKSMHKPISTMMRVHCFLSNEVGSSEGEFGTP